MIDPGMPGFVDMSVHALDGAPTTATWQYVSGAETLNAKLDARLLGILDARAGGRYEPSAHESAPATPVNTGHVVLHEVVLAAGNLVGARFAQASMEQGVQTGYAEEITYEDLTTGVVFGSAALINPTKTGTLRELLREAGAFPTTPAQESTPPPATGQASTSSADAATGTGPVTDAELLLAVAFTPGGEATVTLSKDPGTGAALAAPVTVILSPDSTASVLSPVGQALRRDVIAGIPFAAPGPPPGGVEHINCDIVACAALTYDDGPNPQTARLLKILEKHNVKATFFLQGQYVYSYPEIARSAADAGHTLANHTMNHPYLTKLPPPGIGREVQEAQTAIQKAAGVVPAYLRPPYGDTNTSVAASAWLPQIIWDVDSLDWQSRNKDVFIPRIMDLVKPGSVILQHDVHAATVDGQEELITALRSKGYHLVTLPQLFAGIELDPHGSYKCRGAAPGCVPGR